VPSDNPEYSVIQHCSVQSRASRTNVILLHIYIYKGNFWSEDEETQQVHELLLHNSILMQLMMQDICVFIYHESLKFYIIPLF
jgi:hypothetical protein